MPKRWSAILVMPAMRDRVRPRAPVYIITSSLSGRCQRPRYHSLLMRRRRKYWHICLNTRSTEHHSPRLFKRRQVDLGRNRGPPGPHSPLLMVATLRSFESEGMWLPASRRWSLGSCVTPKSTPENGHSSLLMIESTNRRFVLRPTAFVIGRRAVAIVLPCFLPDR